MTLTNKDKKFAEVYNDTVNYPTLADVAAELGLAVKTVTNTAAILRRRNMTAPGTVPILVSRAGSSASLIPGTTLEERPLEVPTLPEKNEAIEKLLERAIEHNERVFKHHEAKKIIDVKVKIDGPFGIVGLPDPHLNNPGTLLRKAFSDAEIIRDTDGLFCVGIGDWLDNFIIGRLEAERRGDVMSHSDAVRLQEHYVCTVADKLIAAVGGNHNDWPTKLGGEDALAKLFNDLGLSSIYDADEVRVRLNTPSGKSFMHLARHKYPGNSQLNSVHGVLKWMTERWQGEDVFWGGHTHVAGHAEIEKFWEGDSRVIHGIQLASYKAVDGYSVKEGFKPNTPFVTPMVIHDPDNGKTYFFDDMNFGVEVLKNMRKAYS